MSKKTENPPIAPEVDDDEPDDWYVFAITDGLGLTGVGISGSSVRVAQVGIGC